MDVRSLYTNIPTNEGLEAVNETLKKPLNLNSLLSPPEVILEFLKHILTCNSFEFNGKHFLHMKECAMGTICAPSYANIFIGKFEDTFIYPFIKDLCKLYLRYIDDIFMIWTGTKEQFYQFDSTLNNCHHSIKFDHEISPDEVNVLDTTVYVDTNGTIQTKLYTKHTDRHNYLHRRYEHPLPLKYNLAYSQALRIRRICSNEEHYRERCSNEEHYRETC